MFTDEQVEAAAKELHHFIGRPWAGFAWEELSTSYQNNLKDTVYLILKATMEPVHKSSTAWCEQTGIVVMDPDGWNRKDFENSWSELISRAEFLFRARRSTCLHWPNLLLDQDVA